MKIDRNIAVALLNAEKLEDLYDAETIERIENFLVIRPFFTIVEDAESNDINGRCSITGLYTTVVEIQ